MSERIVVLLHGFLMSARLWDDVVERLPSGVRAIVPNLRGHGDAPVTSAVTVAEMAGDVECRLEAEIGAAPVTVVGFSLGGYVALELMRAGRRRLNAAVLVATRARADDEGEVAHRHALLRRVTSDGTAPAVEHYLPRLFSPTSSPALREAWRVSMSMTDPVGAGAALEAMAVRADAEEVLVACACPVHILVGRDDVLTPPAEALRMRSLAPRAALDTVDNAGHMLPVEAPDAVARAVISAAESP